MNKTIASCFGIALLIGAASPVLAEAGADANNLGYQAIQDGKWAEAESQIRAGLAQNPKDPMRLLNLAYVLQNTGRQDEAAGVYEQVLQLDRDPLVAVGADSKVRPMRAKILAKKGMASLETNK